MTLATISPPDPFSVCTHYNNPGPAFNVVSPHSLGICIYNDQEGYAYTMIRSIEFKVLTHKVSTSQADKDVEALVENCLSMWSSNE